MSALDRRMGTMNDTMQADCDPAPSYARSLAHAPYRNAAALILALGYTGCSGIALRPMVAGRQTQTAAFVRVFTDFAAVRYFVERHPDMALGPYAARRVSIVGGWPHRIGTRSVVLPEW